MPRLGYDVTVRCPATAHKRTYFNITRQYRKEGWRVFESRLHGRSVNYRENGLIVSWVPSERLEEDIS